MVHAEIHFTYDHPITAIAHPSGTMAIIESADLDGRPGGPMGRGRVVFSTEHVAVIERLAAILRQQADAQDAELIEQAATQTQAAT